MLEGIPKLILPDVWNGNHYPMMEGESPIAKQFNRYQSEAWVSTGTFYQPEDLLLQILALDFNRRYSDM